MSVKVTFTFNTPAEAAEFLAIVTPKTEPVTPAAVERRLAAANHAAEIAAGKSVEKPAKPKVTPKVTPPAPRAEAAAENAAPAPVVAAPPMPMIVPPPATPAATATTALTLDDVRAALRTVFNKPGGTGAQAATALLKKYNATSVSQVKPEDYAAFIKECQ